MSLTNEDKEWILAENANTVSALERVGTALLTEFHKWASPVKQKLQSRREAIRALDLDLEHLTGRVDKFDPKQPARYDLAHVRLTAQGKRLELA